nr:hypothetical protein [Tanacetum cinerariifolium]
MIFDGMVRNVNNKGSNFLMYPRVKAHELQLSPITHPLLRATWIAQFKALPIAANGPASLLRDDSQGEAFTTVSGLEAGQDRKNIIKTSALPHDTTPRVISLDADEGSMQQQIQELTDLYTRLQRQQTEMATKIIAQDLEISSLKARIKLLEDKDRGTAELSRDDALIKGRSLETGEEAGVERSTERGSNDTEELVNVLSSMDAAIILTSRVQAISVPPVVEVSTVGVLTGSGLVSTISAIFTTASVVASYSRCQREISVKDKEMEEQMARENQKMDEQIARDAKIARIHAEEELQMLIDGLDKNNKVIAKNLHEYEQDAADLRMTLEEIREKFILVWKQIENFVPMASKEEGERVKRKGLKLEQGSAKKMKTSEDVESVVPEIGSTTLNDKVIVTLSSLK